MQFRTQPSPDYTPARWPVAGRPVRPYEIDPLAVTDAASPAIPAEAHSAGTLLLLEPITPHLLRLSAEDPDTFVEFAAALGLGEFLEWAFAANLAAWIPIQEAYDAGQRSFTADDLQAAWLDPISSVTFDNAQAVIRRTMSEASEFDPSTALRVALNHGWEQNIFEIDLDLDEATGVLYEQPRHIFARAWFELIHSLGKGVLPAVCPHCGVHFPPERSNKRYCGMACQRAAADRRRNPKRRDYFREHKRSQRRSSKETD